MRGYQRLGVLLAPAIKTTWRRLLVVLGLAWMCHGAGLDWNPVATLFALGWVTQAWDSAKERTTEVN